jgi:hypothetical protein
MISFRRSNYFKIILAVRDVAVALPTACHGRDYNKDNRLAAGIALKQNVFVDMSRIGIRPNQKKPS